MADISLTPTTASSSRNPPCAVCAVNPSKYTCPRCSLRTCSLACSNAHKFPSEGGAGCSGERNKVAYVPPNKYGYGQLMDDYSFLEETRRKVEGWGASAAMNGGAKDTHSISASTNGKGKKPHQGHQAGGSQARNDHLAREIAARLGGAQVVFLPDGMQRRKMNQSAWNAKSRTMHLSIECAFPNLTSSAAGATAASTSTSSKQAQSPLTAQSSSSSSPSPATILLPRVLVIESGGLPSRMTLAELFKAQILKHPKRPKGLEGWWSSLIEAQTQTHNQQEVQGSGPPDEADERRSEVVVFAVRVVQAPGLPDVTPPPPPSNKTNTNGSQRRLYHPAQTGTSTLISLLQGIVGFVEYPTIEVWARSEWERAVKEGEVGVVGMCGEDGLGVEVVVVAGEKEQDKTSESSESRKGVETARDVAMQDEPSASAVAVEKQHQEPQAQVQATSVDITPSATAAAATDAIQQEDSSASAASLQPTKEEDDVAARNTAPKSGEDVDDPSALSSSNDDAIQLPDRKVTVAIKRSTDALNDDGAYSISPPLAVEPDHHQDAAVINEGVAEGAGAEGAEERSAKRMRLDLEAEGENSAQEPVARS